MSRVLLLLIATFLASTLGAKNFTRADGVKVRSDRNVLLAAEKWDLATHNWDNLKDAKLYYSKDKGATWLEDKASLQRPSSPINGKMLPYFTFRADSDGLYGFYQAKPAQAAPVEDTTPNFYLYFDSSAPSVVIKSPVDGQYLTVGESVKIDYSVKDANLDRDAGLNITYSTDGGKTFQEIVTKGAVTGSYVWNHNLTSEADLWINVTINDLVGNSQPVQVQRLKVGQVNEVKKADKPSVDFSGPLFGLEQADLGKIYFESTDFYYTVNNRTGSPTSMVVLWYKISGKDWVAGGVDTSGDTRGKITIDFPKQMRRNENYGNFVQMSFYFQVITEDGIANKPDPVSTSSADESYMVDTAAPHLALLGPLPGTKLYKKKIPNNPDSGKLKISWAGADRNPIPYITKRGHERGPVTIQWRVFGSRETNDWQVLADRLPLRGVFLVENDLPAGKIEIKVSATDQMGNVKEQRSRPIEVIDASGYSDPVKGLANLDADRIWTKGLSFYKAEQYVKAEAEFKKALKIVPSEKKDELTHDMALAIYKQGKITAATRTLTKIIGNQPENMTFRYTLATIYYRSGQRDDARSQLLKIVPVDSKEPHVKARSMLAAIENDRGNAAKAKEQWTFVEQHASKTSDEYRDAKEQLKLLAAKEANKGNQPAKANE